MLGRFMHHRWKGKQEWLADVSEELSYIGKTADAANMIQILVRLNTSADCYIAVGVRHDGTV